jgi:hypothetical protein
MSLVELSPQGIAELSEIVGARGARPQISDNELRLYRTIARITTG